MKKLLLLAGASLLMAACAESPTAPAAHKKTPGDAKLDLTCRSGYVVAYDEFGNPYCAPVEGTSSASTPTSGTARPRP